MDSPHAELCICEGKFHITLRQIVLKEATRCNALNLEEHQAIIVQMKKRVQEMKRHRDVVCSHMRHPTLTRCLGDREYEQDSDAGDGR
eukprot:1369800-Prymnesium_polylepis.1